MPVRRQPPLLDDEGRKAFGALFILIMGLLSSVGLVCLFWSIWVGHDLAVRLQKTGALALILCVLFGIALWLLTLNVEDDGT